MIDKLCAAILFLFGCAGYPVILLLGSWLGERRCKKRLEFLEERIKSLRKSVDYYRKLYQEVRREYENFKRIYLERHPYLTSSDYDEWGD